MWRWRFSLGGSGVDRRLFLFLIFFCHSLGFITRGTWDDGWVFFAIARDGYDGVPRSYLYELFLYPYLARPMVDILQEQALFVVSAVGALVGVLLFYAIMRRLGITPGWAVLGAGVFSLSVDARGGVVHRLVHRLY